MPPRTDAHRERDAEIFRRWRANERQTDLATAYGLSGSRINSIICAEIRREKYRHQRERERRRSELMQAFPYLGACLVLVRMWATLEAIRLEAERASADRPSERDWLYIG